MQSSILAWGHANLLGLYDFRYLHSKNDDDISSQEVMEFQLPWGVTIAIKPAVDKNYAANGGIRTFL